LVLIEFTHKNIASNLIAQELIRNHGFCKVNEDEWTKGDITLRNVKTDSILDVPCTDKETIIVLSTHKSKIKEKIMTAHYPGNWDKAEMKGKERTLNIAPTNLLKNISLEIKKEAEKIGWAFSLEVDHHGPTGNSPIIFVEIGSTEEEWSDQKAARAMANAVINGVVNETRYTPVAAFGGGHYPKSFNKIQLENRYAIGHIAPKFVLDNLDEEMFKQAIEKNVEKVSKILVSKEETNVLQKKKIAEYAAKFGIEIELV
jgi:D-tyrosyl-tRNA(Tyr) deacylase